LASQGIDISKNWSKSVDDLPRDFVQNLDFVITLCAEEICPHFNSKAKRLHWPIPDPAPAPERQKFQAFMQARDQIRQKLDEFQNEYFGSASPQ
jgi:arsenate reductase